MVVRYTPPRPARLGADQRRQQLLGVARSVIAEGGLEVLTMERLAAMSEVSRALVYQHFGNVAELLNALLEAEWEWLEPRIAAGLASAGTLEERVTAVGQPYFEAKAERGPVFAALLLGAPHEAIRAGQEEYYRRVVHFWRQEAMSTIELDEETATLAVVGLIGAFNSLVSLWWSHDQSDPGPTQRLLITMVRGTMLQVASTGQAADILPAVPASPAV